MNMLNCDLEEWEKEGYSSEEDYRDDEYDNYVARKCLEEAEKRAEKKIEN